MNGQAAWNIGMNPTFGIASQQTQPSPPPKSPMQVHAETIHDSASRFHELNGRLCQAIDRISGPAPEAAGTGKDQPPPSGALMVAQFGVERINQSVGRLADLVSRLETIV